MNLKRAMNEIHKEESFSIEFPQPVDRETIDSAFYIPEGQDQVRARLLSTEHNRNETRGNSLRQITLSKFVNYNNEDSELRVKDHWSEQGFFHIVEPRVSEVDYISERENPSIGISNNLQNLNRSKLGNQSPLAHQETYKNEKSNNIVGEISHRELHKDVDNYLKLIGISQKNKATADVVSTKPGNSQPKESTKINEFVYKESLCVNEVNNHKANSENQEKINFSEFLRRMTKSDRDSARSILNGPRRECSSPLILSQKTEVATNLILRKSMKEDDYGLLNDKNRSVSHINQTNKNDLIMGKNSHQINSKLNQCENALINKNQTYSSKRLEFQQVDSNITECQRKSIPLQENKISVLHESTINKQANKLVLNEKLSLQTQEQNLNYTKFHPQVINSPKDSRTLKNIPNFNLKIDKFGVEKDNYKLFDDFPFKRSQNLQTCDPSGILMSEKTASQSHQPNMQKNCSASCSNLVPVDKRSFYMTNPLMIPLALPIDLNSNKQNSSKPKPIITSPSRQNSIFKNVNQYNLEKLKKSNSKFEQQVPLNDLQNLPRNSNIAESNKIDKNKILSPSSSISSKKRESLNFNDNQFQGLFSTISVSKIQVNNLSTPKYVINPEVTKGSKICILNTDTIKRVQDLEITVPASSEYDLNVNYLMSPSGKAKNRNELTYIDTYQEYCSKSKALPTSSGPQWNKNGNNNHNTRKMNKPSINMSKFSLTNNLQMPISGSPPKNTLTLQTYSQNSSKANFYNLNGDNNVFQSPNYFLKGHELVQKGCEDNNKADTFLFQKIDNSHNIVNNHQPFQSEINKNLVIYQKSQKNELLKSLPQNHQFKLQQKVIPSLKKIEFDSRTLIDTRSLQPSPRNNHGTIYSFSNISSPRKNEQISFTDSYKCVPLSNQDSCRPFNSQAIYKNEMHQIKSTLHHSRDLNLVHTTPNIQKIPQHEGVLCSFNFVQNKNQHQPRHPCYENNRLVENEYFSGTDLIFTDRVDLNSKPSTSFEPTFNKNDPQITAIFSRKCEPSIERRVLQPQSFKEQISNQTVYSGINEYTRKTPFGNNPVSSRENIIPAKITLNRVAPFDRKLSEPIIKSQRAAIWMNAVIPPPQRNSKQVSQVVPKNKNICAYSNSIKSPLFCSRSVENIMPLRSLGFQTGRKFF
jgi:hypothetical protein